MVYLLTEDTLRKVIRNYEASDTAILLYGEYKGMAWCKEVLAPKNTTKDLTIAELIVSNTNSLREGEDILQVVIRTPGMIDRTEQYHIFHGEELSPNLLPLILSVANSCKIED